MYIPGHLSVGYLVAVAHARRAEGRAPRFRSEVLPVLMGALTPDLIDKPLMYAGVFAHGRSVGHSVAFLLGLILIWAVLRRRQVAGRKAPAVGAGITGVMGMWILGIASHFPVDFADDWLGAMISGGVLFSTWWAEPVVNPSHYDIRQTDPWVPAYGGLTPLEILAIVLAVGTAARMFQAETRNPGGSFDA